MRRRHLRRCAARLRSHYRTAISEFEEVRNSENLGNSRASKTFENSKNSGCEGALGGLNFSEVVDFLELEDALRILGTLTLPDNSQQSRSSSTSSSSSLFCVLRILRVLRSRRSLRTLGSGPFVRLPGFRISFRILGSGPEPRPLGHLRILWVLRLLASRPEPIIPRHHRIPRM